MKRQHPGGLGLVLLAVGGLILGAVLFGRLFKLALVAGAAFVVWKLVFGRDEKGRAEARPVPVEMLPLLPLSDLEADPERARLDRELDAAIAAANARGRGAPQAM
jgi:hypothetical protein